jgi:branched-chain amino acid aminotransferase
MVKGSELFTPPKYASILPGITRDSVIAVAADLGYKVTETDIARNTLYNADEAFFTGTAAEITPIRQIDGIEIGKPGPVTKKIQERFFAIAKGKDAKYEKWLYRV